MNTPLHPRDLGAAGARALTTRRGFVAAMSLAGVSLYGLWAAYGAAPLSFWGTEPGNGHGPGGTLRRRAPATAATRRS